MSEPILEMPTCVVFFFQQADKRGYPPYPHPSYLPHYMYPYSLSPYYGPGVYGRGYVMPPVYHAPPMSIAMRHDTPSCSWAADPPRDLERRDDNITGIYLLILKLKTMAHYN